MIPAIAVMISAYIVTRMIEILFNNERARIVKIAAVITIVLVLISINDVMNASARLPSMPRF